eukprot:COSAG01_NODE_22869_length_837_cov_2.464770_1_plen_57_part_10
MACAGTLEVSNPHPAGRTTAAQHSVVTVTCFLRIDNSDHAAIAIGFSMRSAGILCHH